MLMTSADGIWLCRHKTGRAGAVRGPESAPRAPPGAHTNAASSSGKTYTNSDGQPSQLLPTCHSCGEELADAERYAPLTVCYSLIYDCMLSQLWSYADARLRNMKRAAAKQGSSTGFCRSHGTATLCSGCEQSRNPRRPNRAQSSHPEDSFPSSTHFPTTVAGRSLYPKILSGKRTPRKRNLSSLDQDMVDTPQEARGHVKGAKEMSRGGSTTAREQPKARRLNGELVDINTSKLLSAVPSGFITWSAITPSKLATQTFTDDALLATTQFVFCVLPGSA